MTVEPPVSPPPDLAATAPAALRARPELLAPAGDWDCVRAAVENGADAVYFGLQDGFNARARAANFGLADVPEVMRYLHARGVKGYVTLNTLAFSAELQPLVDVVARLTESDVDAVLVQDLGLARLIKAVSPELVVHASTQMTLTSSECIAVARQLGLERVVLPRELSIDEIRDVARGTAVPLEAFVHGALCVAYSGQCLTSESLGGRSANRGQCAQACRLPYDLICDGIERDLGPQKYLLSPQDLAAYALTPDLLSAGVVSFKIEGRLKSAEYVANIVRHYRRAIDAALHGQAVDFSPADIREMELSFSRGFSPGWLAGNDHKQLVPALSSAKRGVRLGTVTRLAGASVYVSLAAPCARGDGVVFEGDRAAGTEQGGRIYEVLLEGRSVASAEPGRLVRLEFANGAIDPTAIEVGQIVWKTDDPQLTQRLRATFTQADPVRRVPLDVIVRAHVGEPLQLRATSELGHHAEVISEQPLEAALRRPVTAELLREQMDRLGHTVYQLRTLTADIAPGTMVPLGLLSQLRRDLLAQLEHTASTPRPRPVHREALSELRHALRWRTQGEGPAATSVATEAAELGVMVRDMAQLEGVLDLHRREPRIVQSVLADFADIREYRLATSAAAAAGLPLWLVTPRIQKPGESGIFHAIARHEVTGILVRNLSGLQFFQALGRRVATDFSLNVTNELTADWLLSLGIERWTASYDLNREQLFELVEQVDPTTMEVVLHQRMPLFHMEHCVFCAVLSPGTNKTNCGRPCDTHRVELRDRVGMEHPLTADVGCRNTLFNAVPQSGAEAVPELLRRQVRHFRVEFVRETPDEIAHTLRLYRELLDGQRAGAEVWRELKALNRVGVTRGTLEERRNPLTIL